MSSMRKFREQMARVNEPGLADPELIKEASKSNLTLLSGEKNSFINARRAYDKMCGIDPDKAKDPNKKQLTEKVLTESDSLKIVGAIQVVKELLENTRVDKKSAVDTYKKIKEIIDSI